MSNKPVVITTFKPEQCSLEECLEELEKYGNPHITKSTGVRSYWWAGLAVFVTGKGVSFDVKYMNAKSPKEAADGVYSRMMDALQKIKES